MEISDYGFNFLKFCLSYLQFLKAELNINLIAFYFLPTELTPIFIGGDVLIRVKG